MKFCSHSLNVLQVSISRNLNINGKISTKIEKPRLKKKYILLSTCSEFWQRVIGEDVNNSTEKLLILEENN